MPQRQEAEAKAEAEAEAEAKAKAETEAAAQVEAKARFQAEVLQVRQTGRPHTEEGTTGSICSFAFLNRFRKSQRNILNSATLLSLPHRRQETHEFVD